MSWTFDDPVFFTFLSEIVTIWWSYCISESYVIIKKCVTKDLFVETSFSEYIFLSCSEAISIGFPDTGFSFKLNYIHAIDFFNLIYFSLYSSYSNLLYDLWSFPIFRHVKIYVYILTWRKMFWILLLRLTQTTVNCYDYLRCLTEEN